MKVITQLQLLIAELLILAAMCIVPENTPEGQTLFKSIQEYQDKLKKLHHGNGE